MLHVLHGMGVYISFLIFLDMFKLVNQYVLLLNAKIYIIYFIT